MQRGRLNRRSFMARVLGASLASGGALSLIVGRAEAQAARGPSCLTDADAHDRPDYGTLSGLTDSDHTDAAGRGTLTGRSDSDAVDAANRGRSWRCTQPRPHLTGVSDSDPTDRAGYGRTGVTDADAGAEADRAQYGRSAVGQSHGATGVTDNDSGPNADAAGHGRGGRSGGMTDNDSGPNADRAGQGRGSSQQGRTGVTDNDAGPNADRAGTGRSGRGATQHSSANFPDFPWPPPTPTTPPLKLMHARIVAAVGPNASLRDVGDHLSAALDTQGYARTFYGAPGGFALVAQLERIQPDGTPVPQSRFTPPNASAPFSLQDYIAGLFVAPVGFYRFIVFVVTDAPVVANGPPLTERRAGVLLRQGGAWLPDDFSRIRFGPNYEVTALIYEFRKTGQREPLPLDSSDVSAREHLQRSGLYQAILPGG